jgi:hypothetical protein
MLPSNQSRQCEGNLLHVQLVQLSSHECRLLRTLRRKLIRILVIEFEAFYIQKKKRRRNRKTEEKKRRKQHKKIYKK